MANMKFIYPFGESLQKVKQNDRTPKKVFFLGVYASAVHAKWVDINGNTRVNALAVASEPYIFWKGDGAKEIIDRINIPSALGTLVPADEKFNGPSGKALDELFLKPLGYKREDVWLCDLLPYSRINPSQQKANERAYNPLIKDYNLPDCTIPQFSPSELKNPLRIDEIVAELEESNADTIILLGDLPIKYFLSYFSNYKKLSDFGNLVEEYGKPHPININGKTYKIIPLVHPRQAGRLGNSNQDWSKLHKIWIFAQMKKLQ
jgi:uracil-DNA glycosylase